MILKGERKGASERRHTDVTDRGRGGSALFHRRRAFTWGVASDALPLDAADATPTPASAETTTA